MFFVQKSPLSPHAALSPFPRSPFLCPSVCQASRKEEKEREAPRVGKRCIFLVAPPPLPRLGLRLMRRRRRFTTMDSARERTALSGSFSPNFLSWQIVSRCQFLASAKLEFSGVLRRLCGVAGPSPSSSSSSEEDGVQFCGARLYKKEEERASPPSLPSTLSGKKGGRGKKKQSYYVRRIFGVHCDKAELGAGRWEQRSRVEIAKRNIRRILEGKTNPTKKEAFPSKNRRILFRNRPGKVHDRGNSPITTRHSRLFFAQLYEEDISAPRDFS